MTPGNDSHARVAWITGGGSGIGRELACLLAADGWRIAVSGRTAGPLEQLAARHPGHITPIPLDVTDSAAVRAGVERIESEIGPVGLAVLNAGDYRPMPLDEFDTELFRRLCDVNYLGVVYCLGALLEPLRRRGSGQILINASLSGYRGLPLAAPYGATKAAVINLAESLRNDLHAEGIQLRVINPGFVRSRLTDKNEFRMPFLLEPEQAAQAIFRKLDDDGFEIAFPWPFVWQMKLLRLLPYRLYFPLLRRLVG